MLQPPCHRLAGKAFRSGQLLAAWEAHTQVAVSWLGSSPLHAHV